MSPFLAPWTTATRHIPIRVQSTHTNNTEATFAGRGRNSSYGIIQPKIHEGQENKSYYWEKGIRMLRTPITLIGKEKELTQSLVGMERTDFEYTVE